MPFDQPETPAGQIAFELSSPGVEKRFLAVMQEMAARFERFDRVASRIETIAEDIQHLMQELRYRRRDLCGATKRQHVADIRVMGGKCPCCGAADVLDAEG
jgi:DNA repair exonuclease SbcCD ATPase subunit